MNSYFDFPGLVVDIHTEYYEEEKIYVWYMMKMQDLLKFRNLNFLQTIMTQNLTYFSTRAKSPHKTGKNQIHEIYTWLMNIIT